MVPSAPELCSSAPNHWPLLLSYCCPVGARVFPKTCANYNIYSISPQIILWHDKRDGVAKLIARLAATATRPIYNCSGAAMAKINGKVTLNPPPKRRSYLITVSLI
jgi:hypothetical protein